MFSACARLSLEGVEGLGIARTLFLQAPKQLQRLGVVETELSGTRTRLGQRVLSFGRRLWALGFKGLGVSGLWPGCRVEGSCGTEDAQQVKVTRSDKP